MKPLEPEILALERAALAAWPPAETIELDGWKLRAMEGVTRRANSVWTAETGTTLPLAERLDRAEAFYRIRDLDPLVQVIGGPGRDALDAALAERGYAEEAAVSIQTASISEVLPLLGTTEFATQVADAPTQAWHHVILERGRFADAPHVFLGLLERLGARGLYATVTLGDAPIAAGLGVVDGPLVGIFSMRTLPEHRRGGAGRATLAALLDAAVARGAVTAYLQVEVDNTAARGLYERVGFTERYGYAYRRLTLGT